MPDAEEKPDASGIEAKAAQVDMLANASIAPAQKLAQSELAFYEHQAKVHSLQAELAKSERTKQITAALKQVNELRIIYSWGLVIGVTIWTLFICYIVIEVGVCYMTFDKEVLVTLLGAGGATIWACFKTANQYVFGSLDKFLDGEARISKDN